MTIPIEWLPYDTTRDAMQIQWAIWRKMSPSKRLALAFAMSASLRQVVKAGVRRRHPKFDDHQVQREAARLTECEAPFSQTEPSEASRDMTQ